MLTLKMGQLYFPELFMVSATSKHSDRGHQQLMFAGTKVTLIFSSDNKA